MATVFDLLSLATALLAVVGFGVHISFIGLSGPIVVFPHLLGVWLSLVTLVIALQLWYLQRKTVSSQGERQAELFYTGTMTTISFLLVVGSIIGNRIDGVLWSFLTLLQNGSSLFVTYRHRVVLPEERTQFIQNTTFKSTNDEESGSWLQVAASQRLDPQKTPLCLSITSTFFKVLLVLLFGLLLGGCWTQAVGYASFPPRGQLYEITFSDGRSQKIHGWCTGPITRGRPTYWIEVGGGGHCMTDLWGLQFALNDRGYRVCQYDVPGTCHSGYALVDLNQTEVTPLMMKALNVTGPIVLLASMDNGPERAYTYALNNPHNVAAIIIWQYSTVPEWTPIQIVNNWTDAQITKYAVSQVRGRKNFGQFIDAIGVEWGIMPIFVPPNPNYVPQDMLYESHFLNLFNDMQWATQIDYLSRQVAYPSTLFQPSKFVTSPNLNQNIPLLVLQSLTNVTEECEAQNAPPDSTQCKIIAKGWELLQEATKNMTSMTPGSRAVYLNASSFFSESPTLDVLVTNILNFSAPF
jgi:hypothetical protein